MRKVILCALMSAGLAVSAVPQFSPCLVDTNQAPLLVADRSWPIALPPGWDPPMVPDRNRVPRWEPAEAFVIEPAVKINPIDWYSRAFFMPARGTCIGAFDSYADDNAVNEIARAVIGKYTGVPMSKPTGDVEVLVLTAAEFEAWRRGRTTPTRGGSFGKSTGGMFTVDLQPGWHYLVISNYHSGLTAKTVSVMFGGRLPTRKL